MYVVAMQVEGACKGEEMLLTLSGFWGVPQKRKPWSGGEYLEKEGTMVLVGAMKELLILFLAPPL